MSKNNIFNFTSTSSIFVIGLLFLIVIMTGCSGTKSSGQVVNTPQEPIATQDTSNDASSQDIPSSTSTSVITSVNSDIAAKDTAVPSDIKVFNLEADYLGLYPDRIYVNKSDKLQFIIHIRDNAYNGLRFVGKAFNETSVIGPGDNVTINAVADTYFEIQGFKPGDRKLKAVTRVYVSE
jgi:hypothetical protein